MSKHDDLQRIVTTKIVAVVRLTSSGAALEVCEALLAGGVEAIEFTFTIPAAHRVLEEVSARLENQILLGAGTVLDAETARVAMLSGAQFIVSPTVEPDVIRICRRYDKLVFPGALTPTEILAAWEAGADVVKIFPSDLTGPGYLKAIAGPLPQVRMMPTGGVNLDTAADFLRAGAVALGVGSALVHPRAVAEGDWSQIESLARQYVQIVQAVGSG